MGVKHRHLHSGGPALPPAAALHRADCERLGPCTRWRRTRRDTKWAIASDLLCCDIAMLRTVVSAGKLRGLVVLGVAAASGLLGIALFDVIAAQTPARSAVNGIMTAFFGAAAAYLATPGTKSAEQGFNAAMGWATGAAFAFALVYPAVHLWMPRMDSRVSHEFGWIVRGMLVGALPFGLTVGPILGLALAAVVVPFMGARRQPSLDAVDRQVAVVGLWLAVVLAPAMLSIASGTPRLFEHPGLLAHSGRWIGVPAYALGLAGLGLAAAAWYRRRGRRQLVVRATRGEAPTWCVVAAHELRHVPRDLPLLAGHHDDREWLLARRELAGEGAYRRGHAIWAVAWLPRDWVAAHAP